MSGITSKIMLSLLRFLNSFVLQSNTPPMYPGGSGTRWRCLGHVVFQWPFPFLSLWMAWRDRRFQVILSNLLARNRRFVLANSGVGGFLLVNSGPENWDHGWFLTSTQLCTAPNQMCIILLLCSYIIHIPSWQVPILTKKGTFESMIFQTPRGGRCYIVP